MAQNRLSSGPGKEVQGDQSPMESFDASALDIEDVSNLPESVIRDAMEAVIRRGNTSQSHQDHLSHTDHSAPD